MAENVLDAKEARRQKMLTEPLFPLLVKTAIPTMVGMLVNMIYNLTDTFWIGRLDDKSMTAAVGIVFSFVSFVQAVGFWFGYGSGNVMSRSLGAKNEKEAEIISADGIILAIVSGVIIMLPLLFLVRPLAAFLGGGASEALLGYSSDYLRIILFSVPFSVYATTLYNQLRLCGNVKDGMVGLLVGMMSNIFLDPVFINAMGMGIIGAGMATLVGQVLGAVILTYLSYRHGNIPVNMKKADFSGKRLYRILAGGAPNFSRQGITSLAGVMLNQAAVSFGESTIAALAVSSRVAALGYMLMIGFGQGFQPICAMNYGAKKYDRVNNAFRMTVTIGTIFMIIAAVITALFSEMLVGVFSTDSEVIRIGAVILRFQCISFPFLAFYAISGMYMQNIGNYVRSLIITVSRQGLFFIPLLFIFPKMCGEYGLYVLQPASDILSFVFAVIIIVRYKRTA